MKNKALETALENVSRIISHKYDMQVRYRIQTHRHGTVEMPEIREDCDYGAEMKNAVHLRVAVQTELDMCSSAVRM